MSARTQPLRARGFSFLRTMIILGVIGGALYYWRIEIPVIEGLSIESPTNLLLGRGVNAIGDLKQIQSALEWYGVEAGRYPSAEQGLGALLDNPYRRFVKNEEALIDPWGRPYRYRVPGIHATYDIYTLGADDREGGNGDDKDFGNWMFPKAPKPGF